MEPSGEPLLPGAMTMPHSRCSLLIVDDDPHILHILSSLLKDEFEVLTAGSAGAPPRLLARRHIHPILTHPRIPHLPGAQPLEWRRPNPPHTARPLVTGVPGIA